LLDLGGEETFMIMKYFASIGLISLLSLLYACAYLDGDGLSKSPEETSFENIQGCFYSDEVFPPDYWGNAGYIFCREICIHDSVAVIREKYFGHIKQTGELITVSENEFDTDTTYNYKIVLQENEADGSYLYNLRIGWEDFIYEAGDYGKRMRGYGDKMYLSTREVEPCKN
jgi:hypothetical protein